MTHGEILALKVGDVVLERRSRNPRKVLAVRRHFHGSMKRPRTSATFYKMHSSWTDPNPVTVLCTSDMRSRLVKPWRPRP